MLLPLECGLESICCGSNRLTVTLSLHLCDLQVRELLVKLLLCLGETADLAHGISLLAQRTLQIALKVADPILEV